VATKNFSSSPGSASKALARREGQLRVRALRCCKQAVISFGLAFTFLLDLENADDAAGQHEPRERCRVVNDNNIERIAVFGQAPVVGSIRREELL